MNKLKTLNAALEKIADGQQLPMMAVHAPSVERMAERYNAMNRKNRRAFDARARKLMALNKKKG